MTIFDYNRIFDRDIEIFELNYKSVYEVISAFMNHCRDFSEKRGDLHLESADTMKFLRPYDPLVEYFAANDEGGNVPKYPILLLSYPRTLKKTLRRTWLSWQVLHGEVALDHLLLYGMIHAISSDAANFMRDNYTSLNPEGTDQGKGSQRYNNTMSQWDVRIRDVDEPEKTYLKKTVEFLFPYGVGISEPLKKTQGVCLPKYWKRIVNNTVRKLDVRDQALLKDLAESRKTGDSEKIIYGLMGKSGEYAQAFEELFLQQLEPSLSLSGNDILALASVLFSRIREKFKAEANSESVPGFIMLWRLQNKKRPTEGKYQEWLLGEIKSSLAVSLRLAIDIEYYWGSPKYSSLKDGEADEIRMKLAEFAEQKLDAKTLCKIIVKNDEKYSLRHFVLGLPRDGQYQEVKADIWKWLGGVIVGAIGIDANKLIPQVIYLIADSKTNLEFPEIAKPPVRTEIFTIRRDRVKYIFATPDLRCKLFTAITDFKVDTAPLTDGEKEHVRQIISGFEAWKEENGDEWCEESTRGGE